MGQQLYEFQEYVTIQRGEMTVCPPREVIVLMLDSSLRFKQVSCPGIYRMKEEGLYLLSLLFRPPM